MTTTVSKPRTATLRDRSVDWFRRFWVTVILVAVALAVCVANVAQHSDRFSPYDEWVYFDYLTKVPTQLFVRQGEEIGEPALEAMACYGDTFGPRGEPCTGPDGEYDEPELYPQAGLTTADIYTPLYFSVTWVAAKALELVTGKEFLTAARAVGALWLAGGLIVLVQLMKQFRLRPVAMLGLGLTYIGLISTHYANTYISTDAPGLLVGSTIALLGVRFARTGRGAVWLVAASAIAVWLKTTNIFAVGLIVVALLLYSVMRWRGKVEAAGPSIRKMLLTTLAMTVAALAAQVLWLVIRSATQVGEGPDQGVSGQITLPGVISNIFVFTLPRVGIDVTSAGPTLLNAPSTLLLIAGIFGWFASSRGWDLDRAMSMAVVVSATLFAPVLAIGLQLLNGETSPVTPRYAAPLFPMFLVAIGMLLRNSIAQWTVLAYGVFLAVAAGAGFIT